MRQNILAVAVVGLLSSAACSPGLFGIPSTSTPPGQAVLGFVSGNDPPEDAAGAMETNFFGTSRLSGEGAALQQLDAALAGSLKTAADLALLVERSNALSGRVVRPDEATDLFEIENSARVLGLGYEGARLRMIKQLAADDHPTCTETVATIIYVNGMNVTYPEFIYAVNRLDEVVATADPPIIDVPGRNVKVVGIYQVSATDDQRSFFGSFCAFVAISANSLPVTGDLANSVCRGFKLTTDLLQGGEQRFGDWVNGVTPSGLLGDVESIRDVIESIVRDGRTAIVVPHSQGNFFVRDAVNGLGSDSSGPYRNSVGVVEVASPTPNMPEPTVRIDNCGDLVPQRSLEYSDSTCVPPPPGRESFPDKHNYPDSDLAADGARAQVLQAIREYLLGGSRALSNPRTVVGEGYIQITLRRDTTADLDLYVTEPDGTEVSWSRKQGTSGELDRDDTDGEGPENWFVRRVVAASLGVYRFRVHHFWGATPSSGTVVARVGTAMRTHAFTLTDDQTVSPGRITIGNGFAQLDAEQA